MNNWIEKASFKFYSIRRLIKQNSVEPKRNKKTQEKISVILDHRLGVDKEHFKKIGNYFKIPIKNIRVVTFFQSKDQIMKN